MAKAKRAKKSKISKKLLILPGVLLTMGATGLLMNANVKTETIGDIESKIQTYQSSLIRDVFTQENVKYLPIKYNDPYEQITRADLEREFNSLGIKIESISSETIGTGTQIKTPNATYTVIIYGDIDGNGKVNVRDVQQIVKHLLYGGNNALTGLNRMAANVQNEKEDIINVRDAQRIVQFIIGSNSIIDSLPTSDIENDKEAPVITLNGERDITLKVFEEYKELGATATDNLDPYIESKIKINANNVNMSRPGDYEVTYDVTDASGNAAQRVTRIVHVVDYVEDIRISIYPKQQYVDGEAITLENMIAYPIYAYGKEQTEAIDITKIKVEPTIATMDIDTIKIIYEDVEKEIKINVTERKPIITLNYDDAENVKIKVGTKYEEGATAYDETDGVTLKVNIKGTVDVNTPGKYVINYESEPNSVGKIGTRVRTVEVIDYITDAGVEFEVDHNTFKTKYVDGSEISLDGIKAYAHYKAAGRTLLDNSNLKTNIDIIKYDRNNPSKNENIEFIVSYEEYDEVDKVQNIYSSNDKNNNLNLRIEIIKKFETIEEVTVTGATKTGYLYDDIWVTRIHAGEKEEDLSLDKINVYVDSPDSDEDGCTTRVWAQKAYQKDARGENILDSEGNPIEISGYVDIYFMGVSNISYNVTIEPKEKTEYTQAKSLDPIVIKTSSIINKIEIGDINLPSGENRWKVGNSIVADVIFKHQYEKNHEVVITNVTKNDLQDVVITDTQGNAITSIAGTYMIDENNEATNSSIVRKIRIRATNSYTGATDNGTSVILKVASKNNSEATKETQIFAKSRYQLGIGNSNTQGITLSLKQVSQAQGYQVVQKDGNYYTLLPIRMYDQYVAEDSYKPIRISDMISENIEVTSNRTATLSTEYFKPDASPAEGNDEVGFLGIAVVNGEEELEKAGTTITIKRNNVEATTLSPVTITRKDLSSIQYNSIEATARGDCYQNILVAKVSAGKRQASLVSGNEAIIGAYIRKEGSTTPITNKDEADYRVSSIQDGVANIEVWAKESGTYYIKPYITINGANVEVEGNTEVPVEIVENTTVSKVTFNNTSDIFNAQNETNFGEVPLNANQKNSIEFWHEYKDENDRTIEIRKINKDGIDYNLISNLTPSNTYKDHVEIKAISDNMIIVPPVKDTLVNKIMLNINKSILNNSSINVGTTISLFNIAIKDEKGTVYYNEPVRVKIAREVAITGIKVGDGSPVKLYTTTGTVSDTSVKTINGKHYTLVPIVYTANNGSLEVVDRNLVLGTISGDKTVTIDGTNIKATFIDNVNDREMVDEDDERYDDYDTYMTNCIDLKYFDSNKNEVDSTKTIAYVGIALKDKKQAYLSNSSSVPEEWKLRKVNVHYKISGQEEKVIELTITSDVND